MPCRVKKLGGLAFAATMLIWACSSEEKGTEPDPTGGDTIGPFVSSTVPADGDTGIQIDPLIQITFSEPLDPITLDPDVFTINGVIGGFNFTSTEIEYHPPQRLKGDSLYTVVLDKSISDTAGNTMAASFEFSFRTTSSIRGNYKGIYTGIRRYLHPNPDSLPDTMMQPVFFSFGDNSYSIRIDTMNPPIDTSFKICMGTGTYQLVPDTSFFAGPHEPDTAAGFTSCNLGWNLTGPADTLYRFSEGDSVEFVIHDPINYRYKKLRLGRF